MDLPTGVLAGVSCIVFERVVGSNELRRSYCRYLALNILALYMMRADFG